MNKRKRVARQKHRKVQKTLRLRRKAEREKASGVTRRSTRTRSP